MKKILLIEDREKRQQLFSEQTDIRLEVYSDILDNCVKDKYNEFLNAMLQDSFNLNIYDIIITHKSAFGDNNHYILNKLEKYCKEKSKSLILFSGGIEGNYYKTEDEYKFLEINSKTFYSQYLVLFLDAVKKEKENLLILSYGKRWKLNIMLNILEKLNQYIDRKVDDLLDDIDFGILKSIGIECDIIDINDDIRNMIDFRDCLLNIIKGYADE